MISKETIKQIIDYQESKNERSTVEDLMDVLDVTNYTVSWLLSNFLRCGYSYGIEGITQESIDNIQDNFIYLLVHHLDTKDENIIFDFLENPDNAIQHLWTVFLKEHIKTQNDFDILKSLQIEILNIMDYYYNDNYLDYEENMERMVYIITILYKVILKN